MPEFSTPIWIWLWVRAYARSNARNRRDEEIKRGEKKRAIGEGKGVDSKEEHEMPIGLRYVEYMCGVCGEHMLYVTGVT